MAGASIGDNEENPVAINVTAMVDVIFCLCVFFMCSLHFRQAEGKFETWLPKGKGGPMCRSPSMPTLACRGTTSAMSSTSASGRLSTGSSSPWGRADAMDETAMKNP